jgi:hypothetical protein
VERVLSLLDTDSVSPRTCSPNSRSAAKCDLAGQLDGPRVLKTAFVLQSGSGQPFGSRPACTCRCGTDGSTRAPASSRPSSACCTTVFTSITRPSRSSATTAKPPAEKGGSRAPARSIARPQPFEAIRRNDLRNRPCCRARQSFNGCCDAFLNILTLEEVGIFPIPLIGPSGQPALLHAPRTRVAHKPRWDGPPKPRRDADRHARLRLTSVLPCRTRFRQDAQTIYGDPCSNNRHNSSSYEIHTFNSGLV